MMKGRTRSMLVGIFLSAALMATLPGAAGACGFITTGVNEKNVSAVSAALTTITPEFKLDAKTGSVYFTSKERVTLAQVRRSLKRSGLSAISVREAAHENPEQKKGSSHS